MQGSSRPVPANEFIEETGALILETAVSIPQPTSGIEVPAVCCPCCGTLVGLNPQNDRCRCGKSFNWKGCVLDYSGGEDGFYEGRYNAEIRFDSARLARPGGRILLHFLVYGYYEWILRYVPKGARILDIGCAGGAELLAQRGRVTGLDVSLRAAETAARRYACTLRGDVRAIDFSPGSFDAIVSSFVWEHMKPDEKDLLLAKFQVWLRPGGKVVLLFDVESRNPLFQWARRHPDLYREGFIEHDGHFGLETASAALRRFSSHGFLVRRHRAMNKTPLQHLPVWGWFAAYGRDYPGLRLLTKLGGWISESRVANRAYTGGVQLFDDTLGRLFPKNWARLLMVALEKPLDVGSRANALPHPGKGSPPLPASLEDGALRTVSGGLRRRPYRLAILISHPVQYFSPLFRRLAEQPEIDLTVLYCSLQGAAIMNDPGFGVSFAWDIPLLEGYCYKVLRNFWPGRLKGFFSCINPGVATELSKGGYDAAIMFGWGSLATWMAFAGARSARTPWMIYGDNISIYETSRRGWRQALRKGLLRILFGGTGAFLASGAFNRKFYELYRVPAERCFDVPFAVDVSRFSHRARQARQHRNETRAKLGIPQDKVVFLFVGKLLNRKRPQDLVEAVKRVQGVAPNAAALLVGEGVLRPILEERIGRYGAQTWLAGFRNQSELPEMYGMADALVLPSSSDPKPLVVNEAMACGLPVIVSDRTGVWGPGDIVRDGENGFVYPCGDISTLADSVRRLTNDADLRLRMGRRSYEIIQDFTYEKCTGGILKALESVVGARYPQEQ